MKWRCHFDKKNSSLVLKVLVTIILSDDDIFVSVLALNQWGMLVSEIWVNIGLGNGLVAIQYHYMKRCHSVEMSTSTYAVS